MESYRTEEEQVEALRRWWKENGRSTLIAVVVAVAAAFGWQGWKETRERHSEQASDLYQALLRLTEQQGGKNSAEEAAKIAEQLKSDYGDSTYAQFAAMQLAARAANENDLEEAEAQLRWVLAHSDGVGDTARLARVRLARVLASGGDTDQALTIIDEAGQGAYGAAYAAARGDVLLLAGRRDEAREAYSQALALAGGGEMGFNLPLLQQKLESLTPVPVRVPGAPATDGGSTAPGEDDDVSAEE